MKTKTVNKNSVNVVTLGCSKNIVDSEVLMGQLKSNRFDVSHESDELNHQIVIINTCGFVESAKQESIDTILKYTNLKEQGHVKKVYVTGCLSHRYKDDLEKEIPQVDAYFGTNELPRLLKTLKANYKQELIGERLLTTPQHFAYLKISEGCDRPCSFCAIPLMRGKHQSVPIETLVNQAKLLASKGTKELLLIAQDLTYYGLDINKKRQLAELLEQLSDVEGIEWIRLHYAFPNGFPLDVLQVMKHKPNICNYLDMPLQHISNDLLESMRRGTTKQKVNELILKVRDTVPNIALRTTLIAGYPGETDAHHQEMAKWVEDTKFERLGIFTYSHEENTHAYNLIDNVKSEVKKQRADNIMQIQQDISYSLNQTKVGKTYKTLIDRVENGYYVGRTEYDSPDVDNEVLIKMNEKNQMKIGAFNSIKITEANDFDLYGELIL